MKKKVLKVSALLLASVLTFTSCGQFVDRADALEIENGTTITAEDQNELVVNSGEIAVELPAETIVETPVDPSVDVPTDTPADQPSDPSIDQPVDVPTDTPADQPSDPSIDQPVDVPADDGSQNPDGDQQGTNNGNGLGDIFKPADPVDDVKDPDAVVDKDPVSADDGRVIYVSKKGYFYSETESAIYEFLTEKCGLNTAAACAVLGNMFMESMLDPEAYGASENAWGLCQWENCRLVQIQQRYPNNWKTLDGQLSYLLDEFNSSALDPWGPQTYQYLLNLPNTVEGARDGALYFARWFERCASASYAQRQGFAEEFFNEWMGGEKTLTKKSTLKSNKIKASDVTKTSLAVPWAFRLDVSAKGKAKLTYKSNNKAVRVKSNGKISIEPKFVGSAKITITAEKTKKYAETEKTIVVKVVPPKPEAFQVQALPGKEIQTSWKEVRPVTGYQIQWARDKKFKKTVKTEKVGGNTFTYNVHGLKAGKTYYVRVRGYQTENGKKYFSSWTDTVKIKTIK